jgi:hypothetical protein
VAAHELCSHCGDIYCVRVEELEMRE